MPLSNTETPQLTTNKVCKQKHTYWSAETASRAKKRRNKAAGINYLRSYQCNVCELWHVTTEKKIEPLTNTTEEG